MAKFFATTEKKLLLTERSGLFLTPPAQWKGIKNHQKAELFASALIGESLKDTAAAALKSPPATL